MISLSHRVSACCITLKARALHSKIKRTPRWKGTTRVGRVKSEGHVHLFVCLTLKWRASSHVAMNKSYSCERRPQRRVTWQKTICIKLQLIFFIFFTSQLMETVPRCRRRLLTVAIIFHGASNTQGHRYWIKKKKWVERRICHQFGERRSQIWRGEKG